MFWFGVLPAQETLPPAPNPYESLGIPSGPYSSGVGNLASGAPDDPIPGVVNGEVNPLILGWAAQVVSYAPANPSEIDVYWKNLDTVLQPVTGNVFDVLSLGDLSASDITEGMAPGSLTVKFNEPVGDGPGPDLVIFGNAFQLAHSTKVFAKLAYVEVSTDGVNFARFPSVDTNPRPSGASWPYLISDATKIYNLFGKAVNAYGPSWGNPFDLHDLALHPLVQSGVVDLQNIRYVRLVAVPGSGAYQDSFGHPIYCPWPTYGSPGPEVQAIGFLNLGHPAASPAISAVVHGAGAASPVPAKPAASAASPNVAASSNHVTLPVIPSGYYSFGSTLLPATSAVAAPSPTDATTNVASILSETDGNADASTQNDASIGDAQNSFAKNTHVTLPALPALQPVVSLGNPAGYDDQSLRPSGVQSRLNSSPSSRWGLFVQRVAVATGWEPAPASLIALAFLMAAGVGLLLLGLWRRFSQRRKI